MGRVAGGLGLMIKFILIMALFISMFIGGAYVGKFHANDHLENTLNFINERVSPPTVGE
jgi:hypothetical protein